VELGCGGTLARALEEGHEAYVVVFSTASDSLPSHLPRDALRDEFLSSMKTMGVPEESLFVRDFPVRKLPEHRQDVLEDLVRLRRQLDPALVLAPASSDVHQDHQVVHAECLRAFKDVSLWGYELPWNHVTFTANAFVRLEERHIDAKWNALQSYDTQMRLERPYFRREFVDSLARVRGTQVKADFAEAFEVVRVSM
jgi:LmbE family N-acetylglucosaminyl deacetylase